MSATLTIRFSTTASPISALIRLLTWSKYSHCDVLIPGQGWLGAQMHGGVQLRPLDYCRPTAQKYVSISLSDAQYEAAQIWLADQVGKPYDFSALIGLELHRDWHDAGRWYCSELVAALLEFIGYVEWPENIDRIYPGELLMMLMIRKEISWLT